MGYIIDLGSKNRTHRTLIALPSHYHRTQTRVIHKRTWRVRIRDKMALRAVSRAAEAVPVACGCSSSPEAFQMRFARSKRAGGPFQRARRAEGERKEKGRRKEGKKRGYQMRVKQHLRKRQR